MNALPTKNIYFASDAHLGNRYLDDPVAAEKKLVRWMDSIKGDAQAIYFLGDMFDYWYEYKHVVPRGHVRFLGKLAELCDQGVEIHLFIGNHDVWMFDYLPRETGVVIHQGPLIIDLLGKRFFLAHGDEVGKQKPGFRFLQAMFRNKVCQFFYSGIHPRWTFGFARRWSLSSRKKGMEKRKQATHDRISALLLSFSTEYSLTHPDIHFFIFGHCHILFDRKLTGASRMLIAGDWMYLFSYLKWDGNELTVHQFKD
ncbi:MAG: UDP-2,3-diacylglucosamine diphosphatase [Tannerella sp.]|jgi:UDP-2,3-diacylglucosamine hydrolase|nr:UDP-2,3-diacylglucosamine diphosphatase [Tannerella sp.]